jgi:hypothetical protein
MALTDAKIRNTKPSIGVFRRISDVSPAVCRHEQRDMRPKRIGNIAHVPGFVPEPKPRKTTHTSLHIPTLQSGLEVRRRKKDSVCALVTATWACHCFPAITSFSSPKQKAHLPPLLVRF